MFISHTKSMIKVYMKFLESKKQNLDHLVKEPPEVPDVYDLILIDHDSIEKGLEDDDDSTTDQKEDKKMITGEDQQKIEEDLNYFEELEHSNYTELQDEEEKEDFLSNKLEAKANLMDFLMEKKKCRCIAKNR